MDIIHQSMCSKKLKVHLKPSVQLIANVVQTKTLQAGESVSYGATYTATDPTIALLPMDMQMAIYAYAR